MDLIYTTGCLSDVRDTRIDSNSCVVQMISTNVRTEDATNLGRKVVGYIKVALICGCSNVTLKCDQHACPQSCHRLVDHSKMPCEQPVKSKCINGHVQTYTCHKGKPASCRTCERAKKEREKKLLDEQKRQEKRDKEQQEHADKIAAINEEIRLLQEAAVDKQRLREMAQALEQKRKDLEDAKRLQERPQRPKVTPRTPPAVSDKDSDPDEEHEKSDEHMSNDDGDPSEPPINTHVKPSVAETEWNRQKDMENASNDSLDTLMKMTGLEEVKEQFLTIKAKTEIALRQNKQLKSERFGIVLLGNPGTGRLRPSCKHWVVCQICRYRKNYSSSTLCQIFNFHGRFKWYRVCRNDWSTPC